MQGLWSRHRQFQAGQGRSRALHDVFGIEASDCDVGRDPGDASFCQGTVRRQRMPATSCKQHQAIKGESLCGRTRSGPVSKRSESAARSCPRSVVCPCKFGHLRFLQTLYPDWLVPWSLGRRLAKAESVNQVSNGHHFNRRGTLGSVGGRWARKLRPCLARLAQI